MKTKLFLLTTLLFGLLFQIKTNAQNLNTITKSRFVDFEYLSAPDSLGIRYSLKMPNLESKNILTGNIKIPYPIIFIHGLDSDASTWDVTTNLMDNNYSFTYGGRFDFNLNNDNSNNTSNKLFYPTPGSDICQWTTTLINGDYYYLNFAVGSDGSFAPSNLSSLNVLSNEASIAKQGIALKRVIEQVLTITGRDKVILMGHSMGGLAAREYLQNPTNWQSDGQHHVAKLITTGTPHGGYTGANFIITGINSSSEAYRDLRKEYSNNNLGIYLFGGTENVSTIGTSYHNNDINCNGVNNDNQNVTGLNQKSLYTNLDYAYIMGDCTTCVITQGTIPGDGVVRLVNANLSNFYSLPTPKNEFIYQAASTNGFNEIHSELPKKTYENMQGLDEPNEFNIAYGIEFNKNYKGFTTVQPIGGYAFDYDDYKFSVTNTSSFNVNISNISLSNLMARIVDINGVQIGVVHNSNGGSLLTFSLSLPIGQYYLEIYGTPTSTSYLSPYSFVLSNSLSDENFAVNNSVSIYPNPTSSKVYFNNSDYNFKEVSVFNYLGQEIIKTSFDTFENNQEVDMSSLSSGVYILKFSNLETTKSVKIMKK